MSQEAREELDKSYATPEFRRYAPVPYTRVRHYILPAFIAAVFLLFGVRSEFLYGWLIVVAALSFLGHAIRLGIWNQGVKKFGAEAWIKFINDSNGRSTD